MILQNSLKKNVIPEKRTNKTSELRRMHAYHGSSKLSSAVAVQSTEYMKKLHEKAYMCIKKGSRT